MYLAILASQWRWSRMVVVFGTVAGFLIPVISIQGATKGARAMPADQLLRFLQSWGILYPLLAGLLGLLVAMAAWAPDHRGRHVHALSLPLPRPQYVMLRLGAGLTVLLPPIVAVFLGALLATGSATIPAGLQSYGAALGVRFALAILIAFATFFAISGGTARTAGLILSMLALVIVSQILLSAADVQLDLINPVMQALLNWPGPFAIFSGRWMLIDV
jgi:hypothetical protein